jgi:hypothetical protein
MKFDHTQLFPKQKAIYALGQIAGALECFQYNRAKYKKNQDDAKKYLAAVKARPYIGNGYYHDGTWITELSDQKVAEMDLLKARGDYVRNVIPLEKYYRKLKHEFRENHPDYVGWL